MRRTFLAFAVFLAPMPALADDAEAVAALSKRCQKALVDADTTVLDADLADDWTVINPDGFVGDKAQQAKELKEGTTDFVSFDPSEVKVRVYGDSAVITGRYQVKVKHNGQEAGGPVRITESFARVNGKWRCVCTHVTRIADGR